MNITPTQADRDAAGQIPHSLTDETALEYEKRCLRMLPALFARHAQAAEQRGRLAGLEEAAMIATDHTPERNGSVADLATKAAATAIATAIRSLAKRTSS